MNNGSRLEFAGACSLAEPILLPQPATTPDMKRIRFLNLSYEEKELTWNRV